MSEDGRPSGPPANPEAPSTPPRDVVFVRGPSEDGQGVSILRLREDRVETGELRAAKEGQPVHGELVRLEQRPEHERLYDVEVLAEAPKRPAAPARKGPAKVASEAYRDGWDQIFGKSPKLLN
ncbi:MAG: hypothetical protein JNK04_12140 [Myxococcales bacterium]|nr:hypothetical protein [Myxococcales bacterium]